MNPVNNGLDYPVIRNRNFAPVGRMGLGKLTKPVGRMGLMNNGFNNFDNKSCLLKDCRTQMCVSRCPKGSTCYNPNVSYLQDPCKSTLGFTDDNLPVKSSDWARFTSVANSGVLPAHSSDWVRMVGFATSLPAVSSDWVRPNVNPQLMQMAGKAGFSSSLPARGTTWQGKGWS